MKNNPIIILFSIVCLVLAPGCAGKNRIQTKEKLCCMSDKDLVNHYEMLEARMVDINRVQEQSVRDQRRLEDNKYQYNMGHLHVGDTWYKLKKEKELTLIEMRKRGISPP
jgi:hypothetical protein